MIAINHLFGVCFGIMEVVAKKKTGKTVSQQFQSWSTTHKAGAIVILAGMIISWIALIIHLGYKIQW